MSAESDQRVLQLEAAAGIMDALREARGPRWWTHELTDHFDSRMAVYSLVADAAPVLEAHVARHHFVWMMDIDFYLTCDNLAEFLLREKRAPTDAEVRDLLMHYTHTF